MKIDHQETPNYNTFQSIDIEDCNCSNKQSCLKSKINDNFNLTTFRHIYITRRDLKLEEKSGLERDEIAKIMGHSIATQQNYLWHTYEKEQNKK